MSKINIRDTFLITDKQCRLIDDMNEFCEEKLNYDRNLTTKEEAANYIDRNILLFKLATMSTWQYDYM